MQKSFLLLDEKVARYFHDIALKTREYPLDYGEMRQLRCELQNLCGITELEALNVLTWNNVEFYIDFYNGYYNSKQSPLVKRKLLLQ